jgi:hypothetical protein
MDAEDICLQNLKNSISFQSTRSALSKTFKGLLFLQTLVFFKSQSLRVMRFEDWLHTILFALPLFLLILLMPKNIGFSVKVKSNLITWVILFYGVFLWRAFILALNAIETSNGLFIINRQIYFQFSFQTYLYSGPLGVMIKTFFGPVVLLAAFILKINSRFTLFSLVAFWSGYVFIGLIGGGRFVILELILYSFTLTIKSGWKQKILLLCAFSTAMCITYLRTGDFNSLASMLIGSDFAYNIGILSDGFGYIAEGNLLFDVFRPMSNWSLIRYGTYLNDFIHYSPLFESKYNAYSTMFFIPYAELGLVGHYLFCASLLIYGNLVKATFIDAPFSFLLIMGLFQSPIFWYPVVYILIFFGIFYASKKSRNYVNSTYTSKGSQ